MKREGLLLGAGLILLALCGAAQTPEITRRLHPAGFIAGELNRLERERVRVRDSFMVLPQTEGRDRRLEEDLAELDRMQERLYSHAP
ncbi:MAG: hypothetical protein KA248_07765 [Kiritimatiellae bacterium]|nr:hypothetical protein [Kiritimatiellia bacterium]